MERIKQYDFAVNWDSEIVPLKKYPEIKRSFKALRTIHQDSIISLCEDGNAVRSDFSAFREDLNWLRENFAGIDLQFLVLEIASHLYPKMEWEIVGFFSEDAVISDVERTIVFDMIHFDKLSAEASLALCEDECTQPTNFALREVLAVREERLNLARQALQKMKEMLRREGDFQLH